MDEKELQDLIDKHSDNIQEYLQSVKANTSKEVYALMTALRINLTSGIQATKTIGADELADFVVEELLARLSTCGYEFRRVEVSDGAD